MKNKNLYIGIALGIIVVSGITWAAGEAPRFYLEILKSQSDKELAENLKEESDLIVERDKAQKKLDEKVTERVGEQNFNKNITCALCKMKKDDGEKCSDSSESLCSGFTPKLESFLLP